MWPGHTYPSCFADGCTLRESAEHSCLERSSKTSAPVLYVIHNFPLKLKNQAGNGGSCLSHCICKAKTKRIMFPGTLPPTNRPLQTKLSPKNSYQDIADKDIALRYAPDYMWGYERAGPTASQFLSMRARLCHGVPRLGLSLCELQYFL